MSKVRLSLSWLWSNGRDWVRENPTKTTLLVAFTGVTLALLFVGLNYNRISSQNDDIKGLVSKVEGLTIQNTKQISTIKRERTLRRAGQDSINEYVCETNDQQDILLEGLVSVAVPILSETTSVTQAEARDVFEEALLQLQRRPDCQNIVEKLKDSTP